MILTVDLLRELIRNLIPFRSLYESDGVDTLPTPDGDTISLWDIEYFYGVSQQLLPIRQKQAIRLCLLNNLSEQDAAQIMRIDETNPVAMYATSGLEQIIHKYLFDLLPSRNEVIAYENTRFQTEAPALFDAEAFSCVYMSEPVNVNGSTPEPELQESNSIGDILEFPSHAVPVETLEIPNYFFERESWPA